MLEVLVSVVILLVLALAGSWYLFHGAWAAVMLSSARRAAGVREKEQTVDGVHWRWLEGGKGPALVLVHGFAAASEHWLGVAGQLRGRYRVLIPDLPGFGLSHAPDDLAFDIPAQAERLWAWLDAQGVSECIITGSSMGGWIACQAAASRPERVRALWLQDPLGVSTARVSDIMARIKSGEANPFSIKTTADVHRLAKEMFSRTPPSVYPILKVEAARTMTLQPHLARMQKEILESPVPIEELAPRLTMPVLVQWGEMDRAVHVSGAPILEECLPVATVHVQKGVGHLPMLETPVRSARLFTAFSKEHGLSQQTPGL